MSTALQIAAEVLPHLRENVLRGWPRSYGHYAEAVGRSGAKEAMVIGKAAHVIGAACVLAKVPVAPIHFMERADGEWRGIFESAASESIHVLPAWNTLAVSSRVHKYTERDFALLAKALNEVIPKYFSPTWRTPRNIWVFLIHTKAEGETTWFGRALSRYEEVVAEARRARAGG